MNKELNYIKRKYGEAMSHLCRELFPTILETEGLLTELLTNNFNQSKDLYDDIVSNNLVNDFRNFINKKFNSEFEEEIKVDKSPEELMSDAGYTLYKCETEEDIGRFKKYYAPGEELCTFWGGRLDSCHVFFAVKKNVDEIKREDFPHPRRQDEYGTSVISIQFSRNKPHYLSIKNRYNHTVPNCDSTFSNNLDNIIPGLTYAFEKFYGMKQKNPQGDFEIPGYRTANDGRYYKYNQEMNNILYCPDNIIIDNGNVKKYDKSKYLVIDYFIIDFKDKNITLYDSKLEDGFLESIGTIKNISVINHGEYKKIVIESEEYGEVIIKVDNFNRMISYTNNGVRKVGDNCLSNAKNLKEFIANNLEEAGDKLLYRAESLEIFKADSLRILGNHGLTYAENLKEFNANNLEEAGDELLYRAESLEIFKADSLRKLGNRVLTYVKNLKKFSARALEEAGNELLFNAISLEVFRADNLKKLGDYGLSYATNLREFIVNSLEEAGVCLLYKTENLEIFKADNLKTIGNYCLSYATSLKEFIVNSLEEAGNYLLEHAESLEVFRGDKLKKIGNYGLKNAKNLKEFTANSLEKAGDELLENVTSLEICNSSYYNNLYKRGKKKTIIAIKKFREKLNDFFKR